MHRIPSGPHAGHSLTELLVVILLIGLLAAVGAPSIAGRLAAHRVRSTADRLINDIHLARMYAIRTGVRVEIRFEWDANHRCVIGYTVREAGGETPDLRTVDVASTLAGGCLTMNNARRPLVFNSRGFPHGVMARSIVASLGTVADTIVISQLGRILREY